MVHEEEKNNCNLWQCIQDNILPYIFDSANKNKKRRGWAFDHKRPFDILDKELKRRIRLETVQKSRSVSREVIQTISSIIEEMLIKKANEELKMFNLELKVETKKTFYEYAIKAVYDVDAKAKVEEVEEDFKKHEAEKSTYQEYTISQLQIKLRLEGRNVNEATAMILANRIQDELQRYLEDMVRTSMQSEFAKHEKEFSRIAIQRDLDNSLSTQDEEWLLKYINEPFAIIEEQFDIRWKYFKPGVISSIEENRARYFNAFMAQLIGRVQNLETAIKESKSVNANLAHLKRGTNMRENSIYYIGQEAVRFVFLYLTNDTSINAFQDNFIRQVLHDEKISLASTFILRPEERPLLEKSREYFWYASITHPGEFISYFLLKLQELLNFNHSNVNSDEYEAKYRDRAIGCQLKCPCCARLCDAEHYRHETVPIGSPTNRHKCRLGHQIRGMNGIRLSITHEASIKICSEITNLEWIVYKNRRMTWKDFKDYYNTWDFETNELSKKEIIRLRGKFRHVWQKIGPNLCKQFVNPIPMKFVEHNRIILNNSHYIFVIDGSGSMLTNDGWKNLMEGLSNFFDEMAKARSDSTVSTIVFSHEIRIPFVNRPFNKDLVNKIEFPDGGTSFPLAFQGILTILHKFRGKNRFRIIFMSDGQDEKSLKREIREIRNNYRRDIEMFWILGYALVNYDILEHMTYWLDGILLKTLTGLELQDQLAEICAAQN